MSIFASVACLAYFALLLTSDLRRPEPLGMTVIFEPAGMLIRRVDPGSAADRAGLAAGDRIEQIGGVVVHRRIDALAADTHLLAGRSVPIDVDRAGSRRTVTLLARPAPWQYWIRRQGAALLLVRGVQLVTLLLACFLLVRRPRDRNASLGAWLLATIGVFSVTLPYGIAETWRSLPRALGLLLFAPYVMSVAIGAVAFTFFASFPRPVIRGAGRWAAVWTPMIAVLSWHVWYGWHLIYRPERVHLVPDWSLVVVAVSVGYGIALIAALMTSYRSLRDVNDRRRLKVLLAGSLVGCISGGLVAVLYWIGPGKDSAAPLFASPLASIGLIAFLAMPLSFVYATARHRLFDVSVIVRRGLQYALARRVLISVVPGLAVLLAIDLLIHGDRPLIDTLRARGAIYAAIGVVALIAHRRRESWLEALDRRFFRERYNAQQILRRIVEDVRSGDTFEAVANRVVAQVGAALHPITVAILARRRGARVFECIAAAPDASRVEPLDGDTRLVELIGVLRRPTEVSGTESAWIRRELPETEDAYVTRNRLDLIVPAGSDAFLVLGPKHSEEPYSSEDADLLAAIGESLALRLGDARRVDAGSARSFSECPACGAVFDAGSTTCAHDGTSLKPVGMPRLLAGRYQLEHRLGHGGMGTVYRAVDSALSRRVAAKVMRDELLSSPEAEERFQREARHAASLAHPNVVTVYDFGVVSRRAFLIMELLEGSTLRDELRRDGRLRPPRAIEILRGVAAAVDAAHALQLVHRDLKPENVFLSRTPRGEVIKVLDFGVAKTLAPAGDWSSASGLQTADGVLLGTLPYMAPEQLRGEPVTAANDLWALAIIAYELFFGCHPFANPGSALFGGGAMRMGDGANGALGTVFSRALAPDPSDRHDSASRLVDDLERAIAAS
jgi:tRNA A-37 threonylcarbamoyl transferase component Bud32